MWMALLLACGSPSSKDTAPPDDSAGDTDTTGSDSADTADTADTAAPGASYRGNTTGAIDSDLHYDCVGFSAFTLTDDGTVTGNAEGHCSVPDDASTFQHLEGPIAGAAAEGSLTATWAVTLCGVATDLPLAGTYDDASVEVTFAADSPCTIAGAMSAAAD